MLTNLTFQRNKSRRGGVHQLMGSPSSSRSATFLLAPTAMPIANPPKMQQVTAVKVINLVSI